MLLRNSFFSVYVFTGLWVRLFPKVFFLGCTELVFHYSVNISIKWIFCPVRPGWISKWPWMDLMEGLSGWGELGLTPVLTSTDLSSGPYVGSQVDPM